jgi:hypothetical protein
MSGRSIIGWDISRGAGGNAKVLTSPAQPLGQMLLYRPAVAGGLLAVTNLVTGIDIWNLDPRLTIIATFFHRLAIGSETEAPAPASNLAVTIEARAIVRSGNPSEGARELYTLSPGDIWFNGGNLDDGCEISSGMQGLRFALSATANDFVDHEIVATLVAIPNVALGCRELAEDIINRLAVSPPPTVELPIDEG